MDIMVLIDTAEQRMLHLCEAFSNKNIKFKSHNLDFADYTFIFEGKNYKDIIAIERKNSLLELAGSFTSGRIRFEKEFVRAGETEAKIYLLIEDLEGKRKMLLRQKYDKYIKKINNEWAWVENEEFPKMTLKKALNQTWKSLYTANSMIASLTSWKEKYNLDIIFCRKQDSADRMLEIFQKYLEDRGDEDKKRKD